MEKIQKQNVGIDVSSKDFEVCFMVLTGSLKKKIKGTRKFSNKPAGFKAFVRWAENKREEAMSLHFTLEATGVYHENLAYYLQERGEIVHIVLPSRAKKYAVSLEPKSKTDKIDSIMLGQMGLERELEVWKPISPTFRVLKGLTRERSALLKFKTRLSNQKHALKKSAYPNRKSINRLEQLIHKIDKQILAIDKELREVVNQDVEVKIRLRKVLTIPGVGFTTAVTIVAETDGFSLIKNLKQLVSYAGLDVVIKQSGKWKGKPRISKKGNVHIRKALYFPAITAARYPNHFQVFYTRLKEKKQYSMIASVAVQRKMLSLIYTLWKNNTTYVNNYQQKNAA